MDVRRVVSFGAGAALAVLVALSAGRVARAQQAPPAATPAPAATPLIIVPRPIAPSAADRAILTPLVEIGRVRSRTPYCAALARARVGIDAAVAYEYQTPVVAADMRTFRFDSGLHHAQALKRTEKDLSALWDLTLAGRADVLALRNAAYAPDVDEAKRKEMLAFANALDGAKQRQQLLAKQIARTVAVWAETPIRTIASTAADDSQGNNALATRRMPSGPVPTPTPQFVTDTMQQTYESGARAQQLFETFAAERFIHEDLRVASEHATAAMKLGNCNDPAPPTAPPVPVLPAATP